MNRYLFALIVSMFTVSVFAKVSVQLEDKLFAYENEPRLAEVLAPLAFQEEWYWPSARLYKLEDADIAQQKATLLSTFESLQTEFHGDSDLSSDLADVKSQLMSWKIEKYIPRVIDFDQARLVAKHNPRLPAGDYLLDLKPRPSTLQWLGLVEQPSELTYPEEFCLADQVLSMNLLPSASKDWVFVIQPNGSIDKVGVAYWNRDCRSIMPGSIIYVPFEEGIFSNQFSELNSFVSKILVNKVAVQ